MSTIVGPTCPTAARASSGRGVDGAAWAGAVARLSPSTAIRLSNHNDHRGLRRCDPLIGVTSCIVPARLKLGLSQRRGFPTRESVHYTVTGVCASGILVRPKRALIRRFLAPAQAARSGDG